MAQRRVHLLVALLMLVLLSGELPARGAFPGTNGRIAFSRYESSRTGADLFSIEADGSARQTLWADCGDDSQVEWDPSGQKIVFVNAGFTHEGSFRTDMVVTEPASGPRGHFGPGFDPSWAPDGARIAFSADRGLTVMNADGSDRRLVWDEGDSFIRAIAWSPLGDRIAFVAGGIGASGDIYSIQPDGAGFTTLVSSPDSEDDIDWSPDGRFIVFTRRVGSGLADIYLTDVAGDSGLTKLTDTPDIAERSPAFSPDGTRIAYAESSASGTSRSIVLIDGAGNKTDVPNTGGAFALDWQPIPTFSPSPTASPSPSAPTSTSQPTQPTASLTGGTGSPPAPGPPPCPSPSFAQCPPTSFTTCPPPRARPRTVSLESAQARIRYGSEIAVTGAISSETPACVSEQTVTIQRISPIPEQNVVTVQTDADGAFSATISPEATASYIARVDAGTCDPAESAPVSIGVRVAVELRSVDRSPFTRLIASLKPCAGHKTTSIAFQKRSGGVFRTVAKAELDRSCRARRTLRLPPGLYRARWKAQDDDHAAGVSKPIRVSL